MDSKPVMFFVPGKPVGQGRISTINGHSFHSNAKELIPWRKLVGFTARNAGVKPTTDPVHVELIFFLERGKSVKRELPTVKPDLDHLQRAIFDALTGFAYQDDAQVCSITATKCYGERIGVSISIRPLTSL